MSIFSHSKSVPLFQRPLLSATLAALMATVSLAGCTSPESIDAKNATTSAETTTTDSAESHAPSASTVKVDTIKGEVELPMNPSPIAVYDMTLMQDLAALDVAVAGMPDDKLLDNLQSKTQPDPKNIGTIFEPNLEALNAMQPQAILIGGRTAPKYDELAKIAPTLDMSIDTTNIYESSKRRLSDLGALFGKREQADRLQQDIDTLLEETKAATKDKGKALVVMVNGNKISAYGPESRYGFIHTVLDIPTADGQIKDGTHGQPVSFEYLKKVNPDWLFVVDRSAAIGEGGTGAKAVLDNQLVAQTTAWKKDQVVYLSPDSYLAFGGYYQWIKDLTTIKTAFGNA